MSDNDPASLFDAIVRERRTVKALSSEPLPPTDIREHVDAIVAAAGWAPFHKPAARSHREGDLSSNHPWRCYKLDAVACRSIRLRLIDSGDTTKIPQMLAVADALIQLTWLPNQASNGNRDLLFDPTQENMEHIAAASAAAQNILLAATSRNIHNYWSSGGALRSPELFDWLGIPENEILLGALFLFPSDLNGIETKPGSLRDKRGETHQWSCWIQHR